MKLDNRQAEEHNAQISERYQRLLNAEAEQFAEIDNRTSGNVYAHRNFVLTPERPVSETPVHQQEAQVKEYSREIPNASVFTTEKYDINNQATIRPVSTVMPTQAPALQQASAVKQESYSLTNFAKLVLAAVAAVVVLMLTVIGINSSLIARNTMVFNALQERRAELVKENDELMRRIENATSEESIRAWASESGMISSQG